MKVSTKSISFRLMVGGSILTLIPLLIVGWVSISKSTDALLHVGHENVREQAHEVSHMVETNLVLQTEMAGMFATTQHVVNVLEKVNINGQEKAADDIVSLRRELKKAFKALDEHFQGIFVTDKDGEALAGELENGHDYAGFNIADRAYFKNAKNSGHTVVGDISRSKSTGKLIYVVCAPVLSERGEFLGAFGMSVKAHFLVEIVSGTKIGDTGYGWMLDDKGTMISHPKEDLILELNTTSVAGMEKISESMLAGKEGVTDYVFKGVNKIAGYAPVPLKKWSVALTQDEAEFLKAPYAIRNSIAVLVIVTLAVVCTLILFTSRTITKPINNAVLGLKDIAEGEGDLTMRLEVKSKDEIGEMAYWLNTFIEKLQGIIAQIGTNSASVGSNSSQLSQISESLLNRAENTSDRSANVAAASEEMSANLNTVAAAMEESSTNAAMVATAAEQMSSTINEIAENAEKARSVSLEAVGEATDASEKMKELGAAADKIGRVTETITEISDQTNLLALNATIEAARAGEAGKGFAVVANEIKELAKQTADATLEIKSLIDDVQNSSRITSGGIDQISRVISGVSDIVSTIATAVEEQTAATQEIANNINQASQGIQEVNENVSTSSSVATNISRDISEASAAAQSISDSSTEVKQSAQDLLAQSEELNKIVGSFKV